MSAAPFRVKAIYEYTSGIGEDLNFPNGQIITVTDQEDEEWYVGEYVDAGGLKKEGIFPRNFVEKYEPLTPPRPSRPNRQKKEPEPNFSVETVKSPPMEEPHETAEEEVEAPKLVKPQAEPPPSPPAAKRKDSLSQSHSAAPQPVSRSTPGATKPPPPAVAEKPSGGSFKDRIAAFNKSTAAPIAPFKPGPGGSSFIKKPFVAPPPSKDAYVPPPREAPQKIYRREEDPDIADAEPKDIHANSMAAATVLPEAVSGDVEEDPPKPTRIKERIALLQRQQLEAAARLAEAAQKKEKPKRPPKKRVEAHEQPEQVVDVERSTLERLDSHETIGKAGEEDTPEEYVPLAKPPVRSRPSGDSYVSSPPLPSRELVSDTNDADYSGAGDTEEAEEASTGKEDSDEKSRPPHHDPRTPGTEHAPDREDEGSNEDGEEEEEEEEEIDPEVKRRMELRARMAKMSGGYGMMGMFGPPGGLPAVGGTPKKQKSTAESDRKVSGDYDRQPIVAQAPPVPIMPLPGMGRLHAPEPEPEVENGDEDSDEELPVTSKHEPEGGADVEEMEPSKLGPPRQSFERAPPPPVPQNRSGPAPSPTQARPPPPPAPREPPLASPPLPESRPAPPPLPRAFNSPSPGEESDDELSLGANKLSLNDIKDVQSEGRKERSSLDIVAGAPPVPKRPDGPRSPTSRPNQIAIPTSPATSGDKSKRTIRAPPIPLASPVLGSPTQSRPVPPPPSGDPPSRRSTLESRPAPNLHQAGAGSDEETTEYDGDYDTDIASGAKHKDALKSHARDSSLDEGTITDEPSSQSPASPPAARPPPLPPTSAPRGVPPRPPAVQPPKWRKSTDIPRAAPPPIPVARDHSYHEEDKDNEYDPYNHNTQTLTFQPPTEEPEEDDLYAASPPVHLAPPPPPSDRFLPPPLPPPQALQAPPPMRAPPRQSMDTSHNQNNARRSTEAPRALGEGVFIATDVDLGQAAIWWAQPNTPPPVFQNRRDVLFEIEQSNTSQRGGKKIISKDVYVLFMDYSQTVVTVRYDAMIPKDATLEQRHIPPPSRLRQDQLESAHTQFGSRISDGVTPRQNTSVGDGTPQALILDLLKPLKDALLPVGTRAYGALVYANLANASTQQYDEIRAGDIVTFRNAKFQGHRGSLHQKYSIDVGKPDHVGIVVDWDGTKKKVRAWEQGRESKKVKMESFKLGELRSGEVKVWRVMARSWVGWDGEN